MAALGAVAAGLATNALYDLLKAALLKALEKKGRPVPQVEIISAFRHLQLTPTTKTIMNPGVKDTI